MAHEAASPAPQSEYNNTHRALLQHFLSRSVLTYELSKPIIAAIESAHDGEERLADDIREADFNNYISMINIAVSPFDLEIRSSWTQTETSIRVSGADGTEDWITLPTRTRLYALVNTTSDAIAQLATVHSADEIAFIKRVLDAMFEDNNTSARELMAVRWDEALKKHKAPSTRASNIGAAEGESETQQLQAKSMSASDAENLLKQLVDEGWLSKAGLSSKYYVLAPRALLELQGWLLETYNEPAQEGEDEESRAAMTRIKVCEACRDIVTSGQRCSNRRCLFRLHDHCAARYFRVTSGRNAQQPTCPTCGMGWTGQDYVGLRALDSSSRRSTTATLGNVGEEMEDEEG